MNRRRFFWSVAGGIVCCALPRPTPAWALRPIKQAPTRAFAFEPGTYECTLQEIRGHMAYYRVKSILKGSNQEVTILHSVTI